MVLRTILCLSGADHNVQRNFPSGKEFSELNLSRLLSFG